MYDATHYCRSVNLAMNYLSNFGTKLPRLVWSEPEGGPTKSGSCPTTALLGTGRPSTMHKAAAGSSAKGSNSAAVTPLPPLAGVAPAHRCGGQDNVLPGTGFLCTPFLSKDGVSF